MLHLQVRPGHLHDAQLRTSLPEGEFWRLINTYSMHAHVHELWAALCA